MIRLRVSRPISSVPSRCCAVGAFSRLRALRSVGSYGAISGAKSATRITRPTMTIPTAASRMCHNRRMKSRTGAPPAGVNDRSTATRTIPPAALSTGSSCPALRIGDPWIEFGVEEVGDQIGDDPRQGEEEDDALHNREIPREDVVHDEAADARQ